MLADAYARRHIIPLILPVDTRPRPRLENRGIIEYPFPDPPPSPPPPPPPPVAGYDASDYHEDDDDPEDGDDPYDDDDDDYPISEGSEWNCNVDDFGDNRKRFLITYPSGEDHKDAADHAFERCTNENRALADPRERFKCCRRCHDGSYQGPHHCNTCKFENHMKIHGMGDADDHRKPLYLLVCLLCHQKATRKFPWGYGPEPLESKLAPSAYLFHPNLYPFKDELMISQLTMQRYRSVFSPGRSKLRLYGSSAI